MESLLDNPISHERTRRDCLKSYDRKTIYIRFSNQLVVLLYFSEDSEIDLVELVKHRGVVRTSNTKGFYS